MKTATIGLSVDASGALVGFRTVRGQLVKTADAAQRQGRKFSGHMKAAFGLGLAASVVGATAALGAFVRNGLNLVNDAAQKAGMQQIAERKLEQALVNLGAASPGVAEKLKEVASQVQALSNFGDEEIITAQAMLLSFQEVAGPQGAELLTSRLADTAAGIAGVTGQTTSLNQVAAMMGKALNTGAGALKRVGISLTEAQQSAFDAADGLDRVRILTEILDSNFGGLAEATIDPMVQMRNAVGDLKEEFAFGFLPELQAVAGMITELTGDKQIQALVRQLGEDLGSVLVRLGDLLSENKESLISFAGAIVEMLSDIVEIITAADQATRKLTGAIGPAIGLLDTLQVGIRNLFLVSTLLESQADAAAHASSKTDDLTESMRLYQSLLDQGLVAPKYLPDDADIDAGLDRFFGALDDANDEITETERKLLEQQQQMRRDYAQRLNSLQIELMEEGLAKELALVDAQYAQRRAAVKKNFDVQYAQPLLAMLDELQEKQRAKVEELFAAPKTPDYKVSVPVELDLDDPQEELQRFVEEMQPLLIGSISELERQLTVLEEAFANAFTAEQRENIAAHIAIIRALLDEMTSGMDEAEAFSEAIRATLESSLEALAESVAAAIGESLVAGDALNNVSVAIIETAAGIAQQFGRILIATAIGIEAFKESLKTLNPVAALVAGAALLTLAGVARAAVRGLVEDDNQQDQPQTIPAFADGVTNFRGGAALVGERGPELVTLPRGANVITNENTQRLLNSIGTAAQAGTLTQAPERAPIRQVLEIDYQKLATAIAGEFEKLPNPIVHVREINRGQDRLAGIQRRVGVLT